MGVARWSLCIPRRLDEQVAALAESKDTTRTEIVRRALELSLLVEAMKDADGTEFIMRRHGVDTRILVL